MSELTDWLDNLDVPPPSLKNDEIMAGQAIYNLHPENEHGILMVRHGSCYELVAPGDVLVVPRPNEN